MSRTRRVCWCRPKPTTLWRVSLFGERLHLITEDAPDVAIRETTKRLQDAGLQVIQAREDRFSLEDVFISIVEKAREQGKVAVEK